MKSYKLIDQEYIKDVNSDVKIYEHIKTKAKVLTLANDDNNKAFSISFRTIPEDSTGTAHIVEHCVLSGSRKYRTKEPFMDMIRGSMQTFLNAMTYPDKTMYPISTRNKKDFYNLMDVYLDSVFYPMMYEKEEIFRQEGWHYELEDKDKDLIYNGVVYNEMKGVYSDPQNIVSDLVTFNLHKDSSYGIDSGGDPKEIPNLSYENFLKFHKKFYHPSNSYIYLYGDLDMEEAMDYIDKNYLSDFDYQEIDSKIILNPAFDEEKVIEDSYSASEDEMGENKDYLAYSWCIGKSDNKLDLFMQNFLLELLVNSESAPLKRALLEKNLAEDIYGESSSSLALDFSIIAKNTDASRRDEFKETIFTCLEDLVKNGINKDLLQATLNKFEFTFREGGGTMKSIIYNIRAMNTWLYDKSPIDGLKTDDLIKELHENIDTDFFERYIEKNLLNNKYALLLSVKPELDKAKKENEKIKNDLQAYKKSLSQEEIEKLIESTKKLFDFQLSDDSKEAKASIPSLDIEDISKEITHIPRQEEEKDGVKYLFNEQFTNGVNYVILSFDANHIEKEDLEGLSLMTRLLGRLSTKNHDYNEIDTSVYKIMGGFSVNPSVYANFKDQDDLNARVNLSFKTLDANFEKTLDLLKEILESSDFYDKKRIKEILLIDKSSIEAALLQSGHVIMMDTVRSYYSKQAAYSSKLAGLDNYFYLIDLLNNFDEKWENFRDSMKKLAKSYLNSNKLIINFTSSKEAYEKNKVYLENFAKTLENKENKKAEFAFEKNPRNEGFAISSNVQYISKGYDLKDLGLEYKGSYSVLSNIVSSTYLHDNIRAKGGAYGGGMRLSITGDLQTYSYRDPNLVNTIEIYNNIYKFIENLDLDQESIKNFIIGTMNTFDPMLSEQAKGSLNFARYMTGMSEEIISKYKEEAIKTNLSELKETASYIKEAMDKNYLCAIGGEDILEENKDLFKTIKKLKN